MDESLWLFPSMDKTPWSLVSLKNGPLKVFENIEGFFRRGLSTPYTKFQAIIDNIACGLEKINMDLDSNIVTLDQIKEAHSYLRTCPDVVRTPTLLRVESVFGRKLDRQELSKFGAISDDMADQCCDLSKIDLYMKMENMQTTGSFKIRGVLNQMRKIRQTHGKHCKLITMSAGNYGKAFAHCIGKSGSKSLCLMPKTAPPDRATLIESKGVQVMKVPSSELQSEVDRLVAEEGFVYCHPFDDVDLIAGYASSALELLEDVPNPDVVLVCCGGGGLVSGVAAAISLSGLKKCRVYAVEPEGAPTMYESFKARRPMTIPGAKSVAAGLAPPYAGSQTYKHCRWFVEDILLVSDSEILQAVKLLFHRGIKAEPSGCAAMAALLCGKVPDVAGKKVVVFITGGNISCSEIGAIMAEGS